MDLYLMIAIVITNAIAIAIVYQFIKKLENKQKLIVIAISVALMYVLISITYWISGFGIEESIHEESKNFITYLFVPVNIILFMPYLASQYMKLKLKQIKHENFFKRIIIIAILLVIVLVIEYFYFREVQNNIENISNNMEQTNTIDNSENADQNIIVSNEITNIIGENEIIINEISVNQID